jgi:hypothetical protein
MEKKGTIQLSGIGLAENKLMGPLEIRTVKFGIFIFKDYDKKVISVIEENGWGILMKNKGASTIKVVIGGLLLAILVASIDNTIVTTALPSIVGELGGLSIMSG